MAAKKKRRKRGRMSGRVVKVRIVGRCFRRADGTKVCLKSKRRKPAKRKRNTMTSMFGKRYKRRGGKRGQTI